METFGASKKRKADPDESPKEKLCKKWRSGSDTVQVLKKYSKMEFQCQREELEAERYGLSLIIEQQEQQQRMISMLHKQNQQLQQQNQQLRQENQQLRQQNQQQMQQQMEQMQQQMEQMQTEFMETRKCMTTLLQKISEQK